MSKKISEYNKEDLEESLKHAFLISRNYMDVFIECTGLYLFLQKKGLTEEYEADKEIGEEMARMVENTCTSLAEEEKKREEKESEESENVQE